MVQEIILRNIEKPRIKSLEEDLLWLCDSFGFSSGRDVEKQLPEYSLVFLIKSLTTKQYPLKPLLEN